MSDDSVLNDWERDIARNFLQQLDMESPVWDTTGPHRGSDTYHWRLYRTSYICGDDQSLEWMTGRVTIDDPPLAGPPKLRCPRLRQVPARIGYFGAGWIALLLYVVLSVIFLR